MSCIFELKNHGAKVGKDSISHLEREDKTGDEDKAADHLEDIQPLFDPHAFWDDQPVPKLGEDLSLSDD